MRVRPYMLGERKICEDAQRRAKCEVAEACGNAKMTNDIMSRAGGITCEKGVGCEVGAERYKGGDS